MQRNIDDHRLNAIQGASATPAGGRGAVERTDAACRNQERFWWIEMVGRNVPVYNCPMGLRIHGELDTDALRVATDLLTDRHPSLRAAVDMAEAELRQTVMTPGSLRNVLQLIDLSEYPETRRETVLGDLIRQDLASFFELSRAPLWRLTLFRLGPTEHHLHLNIHHVVHDAWSIGVLFRDLSQIYTASIRGETPDLTALAAGSAQPEPQSAAQREASEAYWLEKMRGSLPTLQLPQDRARSQQATFAGGNWQWQIPPELLEPFKRGATERGATLYMAILTAYSVFLHRLSGQTDMIVGTMFSGRRTPAEWPLIGCYSNTVALRLMVDPDASYEDLLARARSEVLAGHVHQYYPLQDLVKAVSPEREVGRSVLFSTLLIFQNTMGDFESLFPGLDTTADYEEQYRSAAECDLFLQVRERNGGLQLNLEFNAELFERETVVRFADVFDAVVESMIRDWGLPIRSSDTLPVAQKTLLLDAWNDTAADFPLERNIVIRFAAQVAKRPDAVAVSFEGRDWRYSELDAHARAIASAIVAAGFGPGDIVGVYHRRNPGLIAAMLGAMMAGCAYLPLDPKHPESRVGLMIAEARSGLVIAERACEAKMRGIAPETLLLLTDDMPADRSAITLRDPATIAPDSLAYVIFTSGSTGVPKGAAIEHRSLANMLSWAEDLLEHDRLAQVMATSSVCFDSSVFEIFTPLSIGGTVSLMDSALHVGAVRAPQVLLSCAPSVASGLLQSGGIPDSVRTIVLAGEPVAESLVRKLYALPGVDAVYNFYGLSECAVYSTWALLDPDGPLPPPIGVPIANTTIYVLDADRRPVPIGAMGEIYIGGVGIGREYLNRPDLTAERFIPSPFRADDRLCRTGDLGRYSADGQLICLGRIDHQVKIRGYRIELGDVEEAICRHPDVRASIVVAVEVPGTGRCLAGYFVTGDQSLSVDALRKHLYGMLPDYMVPSYLVPLASIPLNSSGKVDRAALPSPLVEVSAPSAELQTGHEPRPVAAAAAQALAPIEQSVRAVDDDMRSRIERTLHAIWAQALHRDRIDPDAKLFEIGGHSLLLPLLRREIKVQLDVDVPLTQFFVSPTIRDMADVLTETLGARPTSDPVVADDLPQGGNDTGIAIVGFACRVPGASTPEVFWRNLCEGTDCISEVPASRWNWRAAEGSENGGLGWPHARWGGWIDGVHDFEPEFFRLSAREARWMDPQQRLLLEVAWEACERAGYRPADFGDGLVGVYVGASAQDYTRTLEHAGVLSDTYAGSGNALSLLSNRLSYLFGYSGPSITIDTACSSSLVALHLARQAVESGEINAALVAGTSLMLEPENMTIWGESGMLSAEGRCRPFDADANGFVAGEGVIAMTIKSLAAARRDGDQIWAILRGSAVNHDGSAKVGLTAPNPKAQRDVVRAALRSAGVQSGEISLIEAHGTGTSLGDPVEVQGLVEAFKSDTARRGYCALTSMKGRIGHLGPAAGLASIMKVALALHHRLVPANTHLGRPNPELRIEGSPFHLNPELRPWPTDVERLLAGVSAFGFGGVNAHAILEASDVHVVDTHADAPGAPQLFTLSARTPSALRSFAETYRALLVQGTAASLADLCFTTNRGRQPWARRLATVVDCKQALLRQLSDWLAGDSASGVDAEVFCDEQPDNASVVDGLDASTRRAVSALCGGAVADRVFGMRRDDIVAADFDASAAWHTGSLRALASLFVQGVEIEWSKLYASGRHRRVLLPTYPFERRDCSVQRIARTGRIEPSAPQTRLQTATGSVPASLEAWMRRIDWVEHDAAMNAPLPASGDPVWLVFADDDRFTQHFVAQACAQGVRIVLASSGEGFWRASADRFTLGRFVLDPSAAGDYDRLFEALDRDRIRPTDIVQLWHGRTAVAFEDEIDLQCEHERGARTLLLICQAILRHWPQLDLNLRLVTRAAVPLRARLGEVAPAQATAWGLARTIARECHRIRVQCIDLDGADAGDAASAALIGELLGRVREAEIALHAGRRFAPSVGRLTADDFAAVSPLRGGGVYLIAGGVGGIGRVLARFLGERYRARVVLLSRRASTAFDPSSADIEAIRHAGGAVDCIDADIADLEQCRYAVERVMSLHGTLHGVFHLAGVLDHGRITECDWESFDDVLRAKTRGACNLDIATRHLELDRMVLFSSLAGLVGNVFQGGYSAANRFLDAFAAWRTRLGRPTISIDWGGWSEVGMGLSLGSGSASAATASNELIAPDVGMALLERALRTDLVQIAIAAPVQLDALLPIASTSTTEGVATVGGRDAAMAFLRRTLADVLEAQDAALDAQTPFLDLGVDSINSAWLVSAIDAATGTRQRRTLFFEYPTLEKLATALAGLSFQSVPGDLPGDRQSGPRVAPASSARAVSAPSVRVVPPAPKTAAVADVPPRDLDDDDGAIAIVGVAGRFPRAPDLDALWALLRDGRDVIAPAPSQRWPDNAAADSLSGMHGGFFESIDAFDAKLFNISPVEAESMEPQQRMLLEEAWRALENAGYAPGELVGSDTGVFIGASASPVYDRDAQPELGPHTLVGGSVAILANRLSYFLDLNGPSVTVDTLCSSSLAAVHMAVQSLQRGECALAIAGGVRVGMPARYYEAAWRIGALSTTGLCRAFGRHADGMVPGEGLGVVVLKPLSRARADGDHIHAVIRGTAMNHGGRSSGLVAPNPQAQSRVVRAALDRAGIDARTITLIEAHGTGTELGDPIEFDGLCKAFEHDAPSRQSCALGSIKTNLGHLEPAAGIAGLLKLVLALKHRQIPPSLNAEEPNPNIDFASSPFYLNRELTPWQTLPGVPRRAGVSAFGIGGVNVHVVIEESAHQEGMREAAAHASDIDESTDRSGRLIVLSARSDEALPALADELRSAIVAEERFSLDDIAHTLGRGRAHWPYRQAFVCRSRNALVETLAKIGGGESVSGVVHGYAPRNRAPKIAFLFPGQSSDLYQAGAGLYRHESVFREHMRQCDAHLRKRFGLSVVDALYSDAADRPALAEARHAQPALFALAYSTARLWQSRGIEPAAVLGHSLGEFVAAVIAGALTLKDALELVATRAIAMHELCPQGGMVAVGVDARTLQETLDGLGGGLADALEIAVYNTPSNTVLSGPLAALQAATRSLEDLGWSVHPLSVTHAFHSRAMDPALDRLAAVDAGAPRLTYASSLHGGVLDAGTLLDGAYWRAHMRQPVRYFEALLALVADGYDCFFEFGAADVLSRLGPRIVDDPRIAWCPAIKRGCEDRELSLDAFAALFVRGADRVAQDATAGSAGCRVPIPGSRFERRQFFRPITVPAHPGIGEIFMNTPVDHSAASAHSTPARSERLIPVLTGIFAEALHALPDEIDPNMPLLEQGADSLALGNVTRVLRQRFDVRIATRQLFMEMTSIADVARMLDRELAPEFMFDDAKATLPRAAESLSAPAPAPTTVAAAASVPAVAAAAPSTGPSIEDAASKPYIPFQPFKPSNADQPAAQGADAVYLQQFVTAFAAKTRKSKEYAARYRPVLADSRSTTGFRLAVKEMLYPVVGQRSHGARVWDLDGNEYVDITMGYGVHLFGHGAPFLQDAIAHQLKHGVQVGPQSEHAGEAAALLCEITGNERVAFCNSGTEANMLAIRLARNATGRPKIAIFEGCYHGFYDATLIVAGRRADGSLSASPMAPGLPRAVADDVIVLPYGTDEALEVVRAHAHELAGILVEPVQSRRPSVQPVEFLRKLRALTTETGIALIFDEVITGFRVHPGGAQAAFDIRADMAVYGKVVGGGMPIGAVAGKAWLLDGVDGGGWRYGDSTYPEADQTFFATTFGKHPLVMATTLAALREIKRCGPDLHAQLTRSTAAFVEKANVLFERYGVNIRAQNFSSQFRFISPGNIDLFYYHLSMHGVFVWEGRNFFLSTAHTPADIDHILHAVESSLSELVVHGLLPVNRAAPVANAVGALPSAAAVARKPLETREFPLSDAQREILVSTRLGGMDSASYNEPLAIVLRGTLDPMALRQAFQRLVDRHDVLRSSVDADLRSQRSRDIEVDVPFVDLGACPRDMLAATLSGQMHASAAQPFDFSTGPAIRAQLWRCAATHHVLLLTVHHSAADATSFNVLLSELCALYAEAVGMPVPPLVPAMQYETMVEAWASPPRRRDREAAADYWLAQYADAVPIVKLPRDRVTGSATSDKGARLRIAMGGHLARAVTRTAADMSATPFVVLFSAFNAWLHRLTDQDDLVVGVPASLHPGESTGLVGHCINLLPVRMRSAGDTSLRGLVEAARGRILDAYDHAEYPFAELVRRLDLGREARRSPLVNVQFNMDPASEAPSFANLRMDLVSLNEPMTPLDLSDLGAGMIEFDSGIAKFDLSINLQLGDDNLRAVLEYRTDQFDAATISAWAESLQIMLEDMIDLPDAPISEHRLVGPQQRRRLRGPQPVPLADPSQPAMLHTRLRAQAERTPRAIAITDGGDSIVYADLAQRAFRIAHRLRALGVGEGDVVGVSAASDIDLVTVAWAALEVGAAYAWLTQGQLAGFADALRVLVVRDGAPPVDAPAVGALEVIDLHREADALAALPATPSAIDADDADRPATVLIGGDGRRVLLSQRGLCGALDAVRDDVDLDGSDTCAALGDTVSGDISGRHWIFWNAMTRGAHLVSPPVSALSSGSSAYAWLCAEEISAVCFSPAMFSQVAAIVLASRRSALRLAIVLGACETPAAKAWTSRFGESDPKIVALYGPAETAWSSLHRTLLEHDAETDGGCLIGTPLADTEAFVLDVAGRLLPTGVIGELHIASVRPFAAVGNGAVHPFAPGVGLLSTGLRARRRADGSLESAGAPTAAAGDGIATPLETSESALAAEKGGPPASDTERLIAAVWSQILLTEVVSVDDDFFALGGDSLLAIRVVSLLAKQHGVNVGVHDLFDTSTLGEFAMQVDAMNDRLRPLASGVEAL